MDLLSEFNKPGFVSHLAYLADIFEVLNELNRKLEGRDMNIISHTDYINAFISKINLWSRKITDGNTRSFHRLTDVLSFELFSAELQRDIMEHLDCLGKEFTKYFPGINTEDALIAMARNPFKCVVERIPEDIQEEFLELDHDSFAKDGFQILSLSDFWKKMQWFILSSVNEFLRLVYLSHQLIYAILDFQAYSRSKQSLETN